MKFDPHVDASNIASIIATSGFVPELVHVTLVGTMFTHGEGNDYDYVVKVPDAKGDSPVFDDAGFTTTGDPSGTEDDFITFRKGDINIMLTDSASFALDFKRAAEVCKYVQGLLTRDHPLDRGSLTKEERIRIHRIIMNGEKAE